MTDRFEDAVRQAARGLGDGGGTGELPDYRGAYVRGRRRRAFKQGGLASAGALVLLAALTVGVNNLPFRQDVSETDVALDVVVGTAERVVPTAVPTTVPLDIAATVPTTAPTAAAITTAPAIEPTQEPETAASETPEVTAEQGAPTAIVPTAPAITATAIPVAPSVEPTTVASPQTLADDPSDQQDSSQDPQASGDAGDLDGTADLPQGDSAATDPDAPAGVNDPQIALPGAARPGAADPETAEDTATNGADAATLSGDGSKGDEPADLATAPGPDVAATRTDDRADAVVLSTGQGQDVDCDIDRDGTADATCRLLDPYPCVRLADIKPGYEGVDLDGDGAIDRCVAIEMTTCDTTGDGLADTPCIIEILPTGPIEEPPPDFDQDEEDDVS